MSETNKGKLWIRSDVLISLASERKVDIVRPIEAILQAVVALGILQSVGASLTLLLRECQKILVLKLGGSRDRDEIGR